MAGARKLACRATSRRPVGGIAPKERTGPKGAGLPAWEDGIFTAFRTENPGFYWKVPCCGGGPSRFTLCFLSAITTILPRTGETRPSWVLPGAFGAVFALGDSNFWLPGALEGVFAPGRRIRRRMRDLFVILPYDTS